MRRLSTGAFKRLSGSFSHTDLQKLSESEGDSSSSSSSSSLSSSAPGAVGVLPGDIAGTPRSRSLALSRTLLLSIWLIKNITYMTHYHYSTAPKKEKKKRRLSFRLSKAMAVDSIAQAAQEEEARAQAQATAAAAAAAMAAAAVVAKRAIAPQLSQQEVCGNSTSERTQSSSN